MLMKMEEDEHMIDEELSDNSDGVTKSDLLNALKEVQSKTSEFRHNHDMKKKRRAKSRIKKLS